MFVKRKNVGEAIGYLRQQQSVINVLASRRTCESSNFAKKILAPTVGLP